jgi:hypothetical protein
MPNWVYSTIKTKAKNEAFVKEVMDKGGLCEFYLPMPDEIRFTNSPNRIISKEEYAIKEALGQAIEEGQHMVGYYQTQEMVDELKMKYGAANWYEWAYIYWGTKWGDGQMEYQVAGDDLIIRYQSAWSPVNWDIVENFIGHLIDADYIWEEEQGFGAQIIYEDGQFASMVEWDIPAFSHWAYLDSDIQSNDLDGKPHDGKFVQIVYAYLSEEFENNMGVYEKGWHCYSEWYSESSLVTDPELIAKLESVKE